MKTVLKWGAILIVALIAWKYLSAFLSGIGGQSAQAEVNPGVPVWAPNLYSYGVYGPIAIPQSNPFYSSPDGPSNGWSGGPPRRLRPRPL